MPQATANYKVESDLNVGSEVEVSTSTAVPPPVKDLYGLDKDKPAELSLFFSESEVLRIEEATRQQNDNPTWLDQRKGRITASKAHSVLTKYRKIQKGLDTGNMNNIIDNILGENTLNPNLTPLKYGREMEPVAREQYTKVMTTKGHLNLSVRECGLFVHPDCIYMAASPDAVVTCDCCGQGLLEIKCPLQIAYTTPQACPPAYLDRNSDNSLSLRESHQYHTQVLMQLAVTKYTWCDLFVFTRTGYHLQRIHKGSFPELIEEIHNASRLIFTMFVRPRLSQISDSGHVTATTIQHSPQIEAASSLSDVSIVNEQTPTTHIREPSETQVRKRRRVGKVKRRAGPVYICGICFGECQEEHSNDPDSDFSIVCHKCSCWFHWGCAGFNGEQVDEWFCNTCATIWLSELQQCWTNA